MPRQAKPMTPLLLCQMYEKLDFKLEKHRLFWLASLLAFFLLFRKSNLVPDTKHGYDSQKQLSWQDLETENNRVTCNIRWSKTNQFRDEKLSFPLPQLHWSKLCPIKALNEVELGQQWPKSGHILKFRNGDSFTYSQFNSILKQTVEKCGENAAAFSSHSYRHGGCTWNFLSGVPLPLVKILGNWKSDCFLKYIHYPIEARTAASDLVALRLKAAGY